MSISSEKPLLSVVIPVYNEEAAIKETVRRVSAFLLLKGWSYEIIVSNDGSTDSTKTIIEELVSDRGKGAPYLKMSGSDVRRGKGHAVKCGVLASHGDFILVTDCDLSTPIKEVDKLMQVLQAEASVAIGTRALKKPGCDVQQSLKRRIAGRIFNSLVKIMVLKGFSDTQCGFKLFKREAAEVLFNKQTLDGFSFDVEILSLAKRRALPVKEVSVMWRQGKTSHVRLFHDSLRMLKELFYLRKLYGRL